RWLGAQLVGLETVASKRAGGGLSFEGEVGGCYGVRPRRTPESECEQARRELDAALPGEGTLAERYRAWREEDTIPDEHLPRVIDAISIEARSRAASAVGLPDGESVEYDYVTD